MTVSDRTASLRRPLEPRSSCGFASLRLRPERRGRLRSATPAPFASLALRSLWHASALLALLLVACGDEPKKAGLGESCSGDEECASGFCAESKCLEPESDEDGDGIINRIEKALGTDIFSADTDDDGIRDPDELDGLELRDSDGDGIADVLESRTADADQDCIVDEDDERNTVSDGAADPRVATLCPHGGVCANADLSVVCHTLDQPACLVEDDAYEVTEAACDTLDNDCDGTTDEGCTATEDRLGHWPLDGDGSDLGPRGLNGTVTGATPATDRFGGANKAMHFGDGAHIDVAGFAGSGTGAATYNIWVRPDFVEPKNGLGVLAITSADGARGAVLEGYAGCMRVAGAQQDFASQSVCAPAAHWSMISVVREGDTMRLYFDAREQDTRTLGGNVAETVSLVIGQFEDKQFRGTLDDLRIWTRALSTAELEALYREGNWADVGTAENPGDECLHIRDGGRPEGSKQYWLDVDGDGAKAPFEAYCDMVLEGGGWTLAWVYGFTNFDQFDDMSNAVTPIPSWPASNTTVPISSEPPADPFSFGAIDFALWRDLGGEFAVISDLNDGIACQPLDGSFVDAIDGSIECRTVVDNSDLCNNLVPRSVSFQPFGPSLNAATLFYYFDGNETDNWPTHDPCGTNLPQHITTGNEIGAMYLRRSPRVVTLPGQCEWLPIQQRTNGRHWIDPDGPGGELPFQGDCKFLGNTGFTRVERAMREHMERNPQATRRYLFATGLTGRLALAPTIQGVWQQDSFTSVPGRWIAGFEDQFGAFECGGNIDGDLGVGCADEQGGITATTAIDDDGNVNACLGPIEDVACEPTGIWTREYACMPDSESLIGEGSFTFPNDMPQGGCWWIFGPGGWMDHFTIDHTQAEHEGEEPSLRADNPELGNFIAALNVTQSEVQLIEGQSYRLSFSAKAQAPRSMRVFVQPSNLSYPIYYEDVTVGTAWRRYDIGFVAPHSEWRAQIDFQLAESSTAPIWIDEVALVDAGPSPCEGSSDNLLGNGDFLHGTTCWRPGSDYRNVLASYTIDGNTPGGSAAMHISMDRPVTEPYQVALRYPGLTMGAGMHYRLSFMARASAPRSIVANIARFDLGVTYMDGIDVPLDETWRKVEHHFIANSGTLADQLAELSFELGHEPADVFIGEVELEEVGGFPCQMVNGLANGTFDIGLACWTLPHPWLTGGVSAVVDGEGTLHLSGAGLGSQYFDSHLQQSFIPVQAGHVYALRFEGSADKLRKSYVRVRDDVQDYLQEDFWFDTSTRVFDLPFVIGATEPPGGITIEIGLGGPAGEEIRLDNFAIVDLGEGSCEPSLGLLANIGFGFARACWRATTLPNNPQVAFIRADANEFPNVAPSLRIDLEGTGPADGIAIEQSGLTFTPQGSYLLHFRARADAQRTLVAQAYDPDTVANVFYRELTLETTWQSFDIPVLADNGADASAVFYFLLGGAPGTVWLDDVSLEEGGL